MEQYSLGFVSERRIFSLRELSDGIRSALESRFTNIWVAGEISGVKLAPSGHCYFTLKDADAQIKGVCWKLTYMRLRFKPKDGLQVLVRGRVDIYEQRSEYQLTVEAIEPQGFGALQLAFEQLKQRLLEEGLFDSARKRELPRYPRRIGLITSPQGAVIRDFLQILDRRFPGLHIRVFPARVQGTGSVEDVTRGLRYFSDTEWADVVVVARGGGSLEDLWTFNEEAVARAIVASAVPVISAVGHETDFTIADFVADLRAPTPSAAAELAVPNREDLIDQLGQREQRLERVIHLAIARRQARVHQLAIDRATGSLQRRLDRGGQRVDDLEGRAREVVRRKLAAQRRMVDQLETRLRRQDLRLRLAAARRRLAAALQRAEQLITARLQAGHRRLTPRTAGLAQLSPLRVLDRGYAIVESTEGHVVIDAAQVAAGDEIGVRLAKGRLRATVT